MAMSSEGVLDIEQLRHLYDLATSGQFLDWLIATPRNRWKDTSTKGMILMHFAAMSGNVTAVKLLLHHGVDPIGTAGWKPIRAAIERNHHEVVRILCAVGAHEHEHELFAMSLGITNCCRVLMANGFRLANVDPSQVRRFGMPFYIERGILSCRSAVVALISAKKKAKLAQWDKFLLREIALEVWTMRESAIW